MKVQVFVPKPEVRVRDPRTNAVIPPQGVRVAEPMGFWNRRVADGDGEIVEQETDRPAAIVEQDTDMPAPRKRVVDVRPGGGE